ncbi:hypothetical protein ACE2AJ_04710 [Aquihabitans daechungensis]|uniref:hypothetical protein n=1 Tax=Aquihabitans daechungensis TaxID=1052257 RepID=UPI003B9FD040
MATPPSSSLLTEEPSLARIASVIHRATTDGPVARFVHVRTDPEEESLDLGFWEVPPHDGHPVDPLVGFVAPDSWNAVGLISAGRLRHLDRPDQEPRATLSTVLLHRDGTAASVLGVAGGPERTLDDPPTGLIPDVLLRVLGRPTPPPDAPTGTMVELTWLDRIAAGLLHQRSRGRSWRWLADRHPLRGSGPVPAPAELAARTAAYSEERTWAGLRLLAVTQDLPAVRCGPPGGTTEPACTWFDDGSLSRWLLSRLPPAEALVPDLLSVLPEHVGADLLDALGEVDGAAR